MNKLFIIIMGHLYASQTFSPKQPKEFSLEPSFEISVVKKREKEQQQ